jgi:hypothetical protein
MHQLLEQLLFVDKNILSGDGFLKSWGHGVKRWVHPNLGENAIS